MAEQQKQNERKPQTPAPAQAANDTIDLMELALRIIAGWKLIVAMALTFAIVMGIYTVFFVTPMYQATSTIYIVGSRDSVINMADLQFGTELASDYIKSFKMWEVHEEVISNLSLPYSYAQMRNMLSVTNDSGTRMLDITITSPNPEEAAIIANEYAKVGSQYIADAMSTEKPNIMSVALVPSNPISPSKTRNVVLGFMLGAILAAGIITVRMLIDDKYKTVEDIRKYAGLNTLAVVPVEDNEQSGRRKL